MAETGSVTSNGKQALLGSFLEANTVGGTSYTEVNAISIHATAASTTPITREVEPSGNAIFQLNGDKLELVNSISFDITEATNIEKIEIEASYFPVVGDPAEYRAFATIVLTDGDIVSFQGPGTYTITQLDITLN